MTAATRGVAGIHGAESNAGGANMNAMGVSGPNARPGPAVDHLPRQMASYIGDRGRADQAHFVEPSPANGFLQSNRDGSSGFAVPENVPKWMNHSAGGAYPAPYDGPSEQKERMVMQAALREAAEKERQAQSGDSAPGVIRTQPLGTEEELAYMKSVKDMAELARFDDYVSTLIDPKEPGRMKFLMEIYPDFVHRRLQQTHTDYEYALKAEMIDKWGINTLDDLVFQYNRDQGKISGPMLYRIAPSLDDKYAPGWMSPFNWQDKGRPHTTMGLPYSSSRYGARPSTPGGWDIDRSNRPLAGGTDYGRIAGGMFARGNETGQPGPPNYGGRTFNATTGGT